MYPLLSLSSSHCFKTTSFIILKQNSIPTISNYTLKFKQPFSYSQSHIKAAQNESSDAHKPENPPLRTLFPGGYKRPEIKISTIALQLNAIEVLSDNSVVDLVDFVVAKRVGIVVINGGQESGGKLYEAACLLKSVIRDRAYLLIAERVDIATAVNASGVLLSDQGLPPIVARNMLMSSKPESVVLPVVGRIVQTVNGALNASSAEGADFLIFSTLAEEPSDIFMNSIYKNVKIPVFVEANFVKKGGSFDEVSNVLMSGASGVVISLQELKSIGDLSNILYNQATTDKRSQDETASLNQHNALKTTNSFIGDMGIPSFVKLEDREMQFIHKERRLLVEAVDTIEEASPLMEEISLLKDAIAQIDDPFLLVIVVIEC